MTIREAKQLFYTSQVVPARSPWTPGAIFDVKMLGWARSWWWLKGNQKYFYRESEGGENSKFRGCFEIDDPDWLPTGYFVFDYDQVPNSRFVRGIVDLVRVVYVNSKEVFVGQFRWHDRHIAWFQMIRTGDILTERRR